MLKEDLKELDQDLEAKLAKIQEQRDQLKDLRKYNREIQESLISKDQEIRSYQAEKLFKNDMSLFAEKIIKLCPEIPISD